MINIASITLYDITYFLLPFSDFASFLTLLALTNASVNSNKTLEYFIPVLLEMIIKQDWNFNELNILFGRNSMLIVKLEII